MSVVVMDMNGDMIARIWRELAAKEVPAERIFLFDATDDDWVPPFNPLAGAGEVHRRVGAFVAALRGDSPTLGVQVEDIAHSSLTALAEAGFSPIELDALLTNTAFRRTVVAKTHDQYARGFFERFEDLSHEAKGTWHLWIANKLRPYLAVPRLRRIFGSDGGGAFRHAIDTKGAVVLVSLGIDVLGEADAGTLGGLIIQMIWNVVLERARLPEKDRPKTRLFIDEFQMTGGQIFATMIAVGRRLGLSLALAHQSQVQLDPSLRAIIRNNAAVRLLFAPGPVDAEGLSAELAPKPKAEAFAALMGLSVGEAYVARRGETAAAVKTLDAPDPTVDESAVRALRSAVCERSMLPVAKVEAALLERAASIRALTASGNLNEEVVHAKKPWSKRIKA